MTRSSHDRLDLFATHAVKHRQLFKVAFRHETGDQLVLRDRNVDCALLHRHGRLAVLVLGPGFEDLDLQTPVGLLLNSLGEILQP